MTLKHHWSSRFRDRRGIRQLFLYGKKAEVNRENPDIVAALNKLYPRDGKPLLQGGSKNDSFLKFTSSWVIAP